MMNDVILVINAGSSSIKFSLFHVERLTLIFYGEIELGEGLSYSKTESLFTKTRFSAFNDKHDIILQKDLEENGYEAGLTFLFTWFETFQKQYVLKAVGHRIVHGGTEFLNPVRIDNAITTKLTKLIPLAPLHQPHNLEAIKIIAEKYPKMAQVGCFDTAFHGTQSRLAKLFAIPRKLTEEGMIRYGFHGLSYEYIASVLPDKVNVKKHTKIIVAHLGNGSSMCALYELKSVATSMGFTALDGLMMGSRCGAIDPGVILYLLQEKKMTAEQINHLLYNESGLLGVSGISGDVRDLLASTEATAKEAIDLFCYRAAREIGALCVALNGCDAIVFTAGIGEHAPVIRQKISEWLDWMGVQLDEVSNHRSDAVISQSSSKVTVAVIPTNEEYMIAKHTLSLVV